MGPGARLFTRMPTGNQRIPQDVPRVPFLPNREQQQMGLLPLAAAQFESGLLGGN